MKINFRIIVLIVVLSSITGLLVNYFNPKGVTFIHTERKLQTAEALSGINLSSPDPQQINLPQARTLYKQKVVFIDAREEDDYNLGHIHNAINIPYSNFETMKERLTNISKEDVVVTYCGGSDCDLSILLADKLFADGYKKVLVFFGGWDKWLTANYPIVINGELYNAEVE